MNSGVKWAKVIEERAIFVMEFAFFLLLIGGFDFLLGIIVASACVSVDIGVAKKTRPLGKWRMIPATCIISLLTNFLLVWLGMASYFAYLDRHNRHPLFTLGDSVGLAAMVAGGFAICRVIYLVLMASGDAWSKRREARRT